MPLPVSVAASRESKKSKQEDLSSLTVVELKKRLKAEGLSVTGKKDVLIERLSMPEGHKKGIRLLEEEKAKQKTTKKASPKKAVAKKVPPKKKASPNQKALEVYHQAVELMGPERFIEETLLTMKAFKKEMF
jgi:hypothetical protein